MRHHSETARTNGRLNRCECARANHGLGYVFNDAEDALTEAIRAKGWERKEHSQPEDAGDEIDILDTKGIFLGRVRYYEGLRGQAALELALSRTRRETDEQN